MRPPEVLSFREFRAGLAATLKRVQSPGSEPVFVGNSDGERLRRQVKSG